MEVEDFLTRIFLPLWQSGGGPLKYLIAPLIAAAFVWGFTPLLCRVLLSLKIVDLPGPRRLHSLPIPRGGGVALFLGFHIAYAVMLLFPNARLLLGGPNAELWISLLLGGALVLTIGLFDDVRGLSPLAKLSGQAMVALLLFSSDVKVHSLAGWALPPGLSLALTVAWFVILMNAFNLIDGLDGLAAGLALISALGLGSVSFFQGNLIESFMLFTLAGCCLGFLRYNFHPARIFLGDSGSLFLGFTLAALALSGGNKGTAVVSIGVPMLAMGIPLFDTILAVWRRSARTLLGRVSEDRTQGAAGIMGADMEHLHHRLLSVGFTQRRVALLLYCANAFFVVTALASFFFHSHALGILLTAFIVGSYLAVRHLVGIELLASGNALLEGIRKPQSQRLASVFYPLCDFLALQLSLAFAILLSHEQPSWGIARALWVERAPLFCGTVFLCLLAAGSYHRVWSRARAAEFVVLGLTIPAACLLAFGLWSLHVPVWERRQGLETLLFTGAALFAIVGVRILPRAIEDLMHSFGARVTSGHARRIIAIGDTLADMHLIQHYAVKNLHGRMPITVLGLISVDPTLAGRSVYGFKVIGALRSIETQLAKLEFDEVLLITKVSTEERERIERLCRRLSKPLVVVAVAEERLAGRLEVIVEATDTSQHYDRFAVESSLGTAEIKQ